MAEEQARPVPRRPPRQDPVLDIFGGTFGNEIHSQIAGVEAIISKARSLAGDFELNSVMIALLIAGVDPAQPPADRRV
eukprot:64805-Prymnesium_polylepis.1